MALVPYLHEMPIHGNLAQKQQQKKRATLLKKTTEKISKASKTVTCIVLGFAWNIRVRNG
jgi:hypothetical protein